MDQTKPKTFYFKKANYLFDFDTLENPLLIKSCRLKWHCHYHSNNLIMILLISKTRILEHLRRLRQWNDQVGLMEYVISLCVKYCTSKKMFTLVNSVLVLDESTKVNKSKVIPYLLSPIN